jgi:hypothetical protein
MASIEPSERLNQTISQRELPIDRAVEALLTNAVILCFGQIQACLGFDKHNIATMIGGIRHDNGIRGAELGKPCFYDDDIGVIRNINVLRIAKRKLNTPRYWFLPRSGY